MKKIFTIVLAAVCAAGVAYGQKQKVAVYVTGSNDAGITKVLGTKLVAAITQSGSYVAVERTAQFLNELQKEQSYQRTGAVDDNQISKLGKQFGVELVCVADVTEVMGSQYVSARLIDVESATVTATADEANDLKSITDLVTVSESIAATLVGSGAKRDGHPKNNLKEKCGVEPYPEDLIAPTDGQSIEKLESICPSGYRLPRINELTCLLEADETIKVPSWTGHKSLDKSGVLSQHIGSSMRTRHDERTVLHKNEKANIEERSYSYKTIWYRDNNKKIEYKDDVTYGNSYYVRCVKE
jgi:hypothetical protein